MTPEEKKRAHVEAQKRYQAKKNALSSASVARSDKGRTIAEAKQGRRGPGRVGSTSTEPAKTVDEAVKRVKAAPAPATATATPAVVDARPPTRAEIDMVKSILEPGNKPLLQIERDLQTVGIVGSDEDVNAGRALVKRNEIPATEDEIETASLMTAGTLVNFTPSFMTYLYPIGLAFFTVSFVGSRLLIFWRIDRATKALEASMKRSEEAPKSKTNPTAIGQNGATSPVTEPARTA